LRSLYVDIEDHAQASLAWLVHLAPQRPVTLSVNARPLQESPRPHLRLEALGRPEVVIHAVGLTRSRRARRRRNRQAERQFLRRQQPLYHCRFPASAGARNDNQWSFFHNDER